MFGNLLHSEVEFVIDDLFFFPFFWTALLLSVNFFKQRVPKFFVTNFIESKEISPSACSTPFYHSYVDVFSLCTKLLRFSGFFFFFLNMLLSLVNTPLSFHAFSSVKEAYKLNPQRSDVLSCSALTLPCQAFPPHWHPNAYDVCDCAWN